ncbi:MAG: hypothetical protein IJV50_00125 [Lachnospiraceae bacterium]|nr:hypothetical protein [Lachnospiraceae bacterium]
MSGKDLLNMMQLVEEDLVADAAAEDILLNRRHRKPVLTILASVATLVLTAGLLLVTVIWFHGKGNQPGVGETEKETPFFTADTEGESLTDSAESITEMETEAVIHSADQEEKQGLDLQYYVEGNYVTIFTDQGGIRITDYKGNLVGSFDNAIMLVGFDQENKLNPVLRWNRSQEGAGSGYAQVALDEFTKIEYDQPLPIGIPSAESRSGYLYGLWSAREQQWLMEPSVEWMNLLGDSLWTDSEIPAIGGNLMQFDGTVLASSQYGFWRNGDVVLSLEKVYDLEGKEIGVYDGTRETVLDAADHMLIIRTVGDNRTYGYSLDHQLQWVEPNGWTYNGHYEGYRNGVNGTYACYFNWIDGEGNSLVTDRDLNVVMGGEDILQANPDFTVEPGTIFQLAIASEEGFHVLVTEPSKDPYMLYLNRKYGIVGSDTILLP